MIVNNNSWTKFKTSAARYFCNALVLKLFIVLLCVASAYSCFEKLKGYLIIRVFVEMTASANITPKIYFHDENGKFSEENSASATLKATDGFKSIRFKIPKHIRKITALSLFLGDGEGVAAIKSIRMTTLFKEYKWSPQDIYRDFTPNENVVQRKIAKDALFIYSINYPPYMTNWHIGNAFDNLVASMEAPYLSTLFAVIAAILCLLFLFFVRFPNVLRYCNANVYISLLFILFISLPILSTFLSITYEVNISEQRSLATKPRLSIDNLDKFPEQYTQYFEDNFGFRDMLIRWNNRFKTNVLKTSPIPDQVVFGAEGWLYMTAINTIEDYRGNSPFKKEELMRIKRTLLTRQQWLRDRGIDYYLLVPPNKETIYPEYLPHYINKVSATTKLDQLIQLMDNTTFKIIDLRATILAAKQKARLYFRTDTHWNSYGAFLGYQQIIDTMRKDHPRLVPKDISDFKITHAIRGGGDLLRLLSVSDLFTDDEVFFTPVTPYKSRDAAPGNYVHTYRTPTNPLIVREVDNSTLPKIVVFRDSFYMHPLDFFAEHFRRSVYVWTMTFDTDIIEKEHPDIVITEIVERNLYTLKDSNRP